MKKQMLVAVFLLALGCTVPRMIHALPLQDASQLPEKTSAPAPDEVVDILDSKLSLSDAPLFLCCIRCFICSCICCSTWAYFCC
jgi:hypothetical protein